MGYSYRFHTIFACFVFGLTAVITSLRAHDLKIRKISEEQDKVFATGCQNPLANAQQERVNATFLILTRNQDLDGMIKTIESIERHFNRWFNYPYVFLNDDDFTETFKGTIQHFTSSPVSFGKINDATWGFPDWVDVESARKAIKFQGDANIRYGGIESYHHMCRFYSGNFYKHELLQGYDWYWRLEPDIKYMCDITYDPFLEMERANKTYGFTIAIKDIPETVPSLFRHVSNYIQRRQIKSKGLWEMFLEPQHDVQIHDPKSRDEKIAPANQHSDEHSTFTEPMEEERYNLCHFWSNFEIARLDWFKSDEYNAFFNMLESTGGFWTERWGDAPVHSLAAGALLAPRDIHYFRDIGYRHGTIQHCPGNAPGLQLDPIPWTGVSKEDDSYWARPDRPRLNGVGCRCRCDTNAWEIETTKGSCFENWVAVAGGWAP